ncbi:hypothetical protein F0562_035298 [Nyssa sinensis]|uniref:Uncharacterized protein n=1 Tax=Nyssa sinensis TaxID=561372 RepID=A0A5J5AA41_9ASTE|nr:hypothetical protein F0562_035298 [Nyssa sinensis]
MNISTTFTAITGWLRDIEDFELNTLGFGTDGIEVKKGDDRLYTGLNLVWNGPVKFHPEVGIASIDQKSNGSDEELRAGLYDGSFVLDGKIEEFMGFSYKKYWVSSDAANDFQECTKSFCDGDGPDGRAPHDALFFALGYLDGLPSAPYDSISPERPSRRIVHNATAHPKTPLLAPKAMYKAVLGEEEYIAVRSKSPPGIDILHHIENWSPMKQQKAYEIIADFERQGLDRLQIMPGAVELCGFLNSRNIRRGLITRNVKSAVDLFHLRFGMAFSPALSREFRPYKPDPAPLLHICTTWEVQPSEVMMIGDSLKDDVACGKRAGAFTCLLDETGRYDSPEYASVEFKPDYKVSSLAQVSSLLEANFEMAP